MSYKVKFNINADCVCDEFAIIPKKEEIEFLEQEVKDLLMNELQYDATVRITIQESEKIED